MTLGFSGFSKCNEKIERYNVLWRFLQHSVEYRFGNGPLYCFKIGLFEFSLFCHVLQPARLNMSSWYSYYSQKSGGIEWFCIFWTCQFEVSIVTKIYLRMLSGYKFVCSKLYFFAFSRAWFAGFALVFGFSQLSKDKLYMCEFDVGTNACLLWFREVCFHFSHFTCLRPNWKQRMFCCHVIFMSGLECFWVSRFYFAFHVPFRRVACFRAICSYFVFTLSLSKQQH